MPTWHKTSIYSLSHHSLTWSLTSLTTDCTDCLTYWLTDCLTDGLSDWRTDCLSDCIQYVCFCPVTPCQTWWRNLPSLHEQGLTPNLAGSSSHTWQHLTECDTWGGGRDSARVGRPTPATIHVRQSDVKSAFPKTTMPEKNHGTISDCQSDFVTLTGWIYFFKDIY